MVIMGGEGAVGDDTALGLEHAALGKAAARSDAKAVAREYFALFIGLGRGELMPYASHYMTGFVHGRPLARSLRLSRSWSIPVEFWLVV